MNEEEVRNLLSNSRPENTTALIEAYITAAKQKFGDSPWDGYDDGQLLDDFSSFLEFYLKSQ